MSRLTHTSLDPVVKPGSPIGSARGHLNTREGWAHALISHGPEYCGELGESVLTIGGLVAPFGYETSLSTTELGGHLMSSLANSSSCLPHSTPH